MKCNVYVDESPVVNVQQTRSKHAKHDVPQNLVRNLLEADVAYLEAQKAIVVHLRETGQTVPSLAQHMATEGA